ncbi:MAG: hypothetical protein L0H63_00860 [Nitrococcus sp.]|nr:hypothetical protein [Nitrococcus sp.]
MSNRMGYILGALSAALLVAAPPAMAKGQDMNKLAVEQSDMYGKYLVTGEGQAVYMFTADKQGSSESTCYSKCAEVWPPATTAGAVTKEGEMVHERLIQTIERKDGAEQLTYNGWPLYLFVRDTGAGGPTGQDVKGFGGEWYLVRPDGTKVSHQTAGESTGGGNMEGGY